VSRVVDCEWKAANHYDDGTYSIAELARQVMGVCPVERAKERLAYERWSNAPSLDADEFEQAVNIIEDERKVRRK
jgi:hypothetical protein